MIPTPILIPRHKLTNPSSQGKVEPLSRLCGISTPVIFAAVSVCSLRPLDGHEGGCSQGLPCCVLLGSSKGYRILPFINLWTLLVTLNLVYAVAATSWPTYQILIAGCYASIFFTCLFQFSLTAHFVSAWLGSLFRKVHLFQDKIAVFNIPALEIDIDVDGLMVIRGLTISFLELTIVAHGIEVGIKLSDDMEPAIQTEECTVAFFRKIEIEDVYGNLKWGEFEMTFHKLAENALAAWRRRNGSRSGSASSSDAQYRRVATSKVNMTNERTGGSAMQNSSAKSSFESLTRLSFGDELARKEYEETLQWIQETSAVRQCGEYVKLIAQNCRMDEKVVDGIDEKEMASRNLFAASG
jgi:hypothetical protein